MNSPINKISEALMPGFLACLLALCISASVKAQNIIAADGLNNSTTLFTLSGGAYFTGNSGTSDRPASSPFAIEGTHGCGVTNGMATLTSNSNINTTGYLNITLSLRVAAFSISSTGNGMDAGDYVRIEISPDGGTNYYNTLQINGNSNAYWAYSTGTGNASTAYDGDATAVTFAPGGGGNRTTDGYSTITITQLPAVSSLRVRITMLNNSTGERWVVDDFKIHGLINPICTGTPAPGNTLASDNPICIGNSTTLSLQNSFTDAGITYLWQSSPNNTAWTNITPVFFSSDFSSQPANTNLYGNATITGGYLQLTPATGSQTGGFVIQNTPQANINPFAVTFDYRIFDGTGADGMSLSYASNISNDAGPGEEGEGSGIILKLDTYDNDLGTGTNSQIRINYGGNLVWNNSLGAYDLRNTNYRNLRMTVDNNGYLTLTIDGTMIVNGLLLPGYAAADKSNWKFKFSGRTGGSNDTHRIDNLLIRYGNEPTLVVTPSAATYYRCQVTCATTNLTGNSTSVLVNVNPTPTFTSAVNANITCFGGSDGKINITMTSANHSPYTFSVNDGISYDAAFTGSYPNFMITGLPAGMYRIRVKDANGCESPECE